jgi:hypothetical protein
MTCKTTTAHHDRIPIRPWRRGESCLPLSLAPYLRAPPGVGPGPGVGRHLGGPPHPGGDGGPAGDPAGLGAGLPGRCAPGMLVSRAISLCPSLTLLEPDPAHYDAAMEAILERLGGVSPGGAARWTGAPSIHVGWTGWSASTDRRPPGRPGAARPPGAFFPAPWWPPSGQGGHRAPSGPGWLPPRPSRRPVLVEEGELASFLAPRPVSVLPLPGDALDRLERLEVTTLGALGLPEHALLRQFGREGVRGPGAGPG